MPLGFQRQSPHTTHCDLCHKVTRYPYVVSLGGMSYNFCDGTHAVLAEKNFKDHLEVGVKVETPKSFEEEVYATQE